MSEATGRPCVTCGHRMRNTYLGKPNTNTHCGICRKNEIAKERRREARNMRRRAVTVERSDRLRVATAGMRTAEGLGHNMTTLLRDTGSSDADQMAGYISYCAGCDAFMVVDLWESPSPYGRAVFEECGPVPQSAPRRDPMMMDHVSTSVADERASANARLLAPPAHGARKARLLEERARA